MANDCEYSVRIKPNSKKGLNYLKWIHDTENGVSEVDDKPADFRSINSLGSELYFRFLGDDILEIMGVCRWSLESSIFSQNQYYYSDSWSFMDMCHWFNMTAEFISSECGMEFSEHVFIDNGELVYKDCGDYCELDMYEDEDIADKAEIIREAGRRGDVAKIADVLCDIFNGKEDVFHYSTPEEMAKRIIDDGVYDDSYIGIGRAKYTDIII